MTAHALIQNAGPLWDEATRAPFLEALAAGTLPVEAFRRWLAQDYLFAKDPTAFQSILLAKIPRDCHKTLVGGLGALDKELEWFESHAGRSRLTSPFRRIGSAGGTQTSSCVASTPRPTPF